MDLHGGRLSFAVALVLTLFAGCAEEPVVLPPEHATIVLTPPPVTKGPPTTTATLRTVLAPDTISPNGLAIAARDSRRAGPPSVAILTNEISGLEGLRKAMSPSSPDGPTLVRRLAEDYVELRKLGTASASQDAIARYEEVGKLSPAYPKMDEVLYYLGIEYEISGDLQKARKAYFELVSKYPSSSLVAFAYFAFGELFLREAKSDPTKLSLAEQAYAQTLKTAQPDLLPDALCREGQVYDLLGDAVRAQGFYDRVKRDYPASAAAARIGGGTP